MLLTCGTIFLKLSMILELLASCKHGCKNTCNDLVKTIIIVANYSCILTIQVSRAVHSQLGPSYTNMLGPSLPRKTGLLKLHVTNCWWKLPSTCQGIWQHVVMHIPTHAKINVWSHMWSHFECVMKVWLKKSHFFTLASTLLMCDLQILKCDKKCDQQSVILQALTTQSHFSASQKHKRNLSHKLQ